MCNPTSEEIPNKAASPNPADVPNLKYTAAILGTTTIALLFSTIFLGISGNTETTTTTIEAAPVETTPVETTATMESTAATPAAYSNVPDNNFFEVESIFKTADNTCVDKNPRFENVDCIHLPGPQAGANVTQGYRGGMEVDFEPNTAAYWTSSMCPVNVHWHLGTEHYSVGQYDENGDGPQGNAPAPVRRRLAEEEDVRGGFRCHHYDSTDPKFTTEYEWKHCKNMVVGETYEVHWPHSAAGACGTPNQYQTPFYDGVFCNLDLETFSTLGPQDIANAVGVQGQIFTIVNDESYFYPNLMRGWVVDAEMGMGQDIHYYTGSTTGTSRNNEVCSQYTPITWQVDRQCHLISASSFDKLCYDMKLQRDDMTYDLHAHGSRELVKDALVANNQQRRLGEHVHDDHHHDHKHDSHHHHEWF